MVADHPQQQIPQQHQQHPVHPSAAWMQMMQQQQQYPGMMQAHQAAMMMQQQQFMQLNNNQMQQQAPPAMMNHNSATNNSLVGGSGAAFPPHPMFQNPQMFSGVGPAFHGFLPQAPFFPPPFAPSSHHDKGEDITMTEERTESNISATTPTLQPPSHLYNGPPVSALVSRGARGLHPSPLSVDTHHHLHRRSSFGSVVALPTPPQATTTPAAGDTEAFHFARTNDDDHDVSPPPAPPMMDTSAVTATTPSALLHRKEKNNDDNSSTPPSSERSPLASLAGNNPPPESQNSSVTRPPKSSDLQEASLLMGLRQRSPALIQLQQSPRLQQPLSSPKPVTTKAQEKPPPPQAIAITETTVVKDDEKVQPTSEDPVRPSQEVAMRFPKNYPKRLALPEDHLKLNSLHCFLRQNLLEIFVVEPNNTKVKFRHAPSSSVGRVGFRCVFCAAARRNNPTENFDSEAPMAIFYPKATAEIYRLVTSWQRCHLRKCKQLPPPLRAQWEILKHDKTRGKTQYWVVAAQAIGLRDRKTKAGGIHFELKDDDTVVCCQPVP